MQKPLTNRTQRKGFEILVNGRKRKFLPVDAKTFVNFQIHWLVTEPPSDSIYLTGMRVKRDGSTKMPVVWQSWDIKPGDEIVVRLVSPPGARLKAKAVSR
jgi:hypothetical protein